MGEQGPTDPASLIIFKKINACLLEDRNGRKQQFDAERFTQAEFLRLFSQLKNALQNEINESEISKLEKEIKFLEEKQSNSIAISQERFPLELIPKTHAVYYDHAEYILGRLPLFRLSLTNPC